MEVGARVYIADPNDAFVLATVKHVAGLGADAEITLTLEKGGETKKPKKECIEADPRSIDGVPDMQQIDSLNEASLLGCRVMRTCSLYDCEILSASLRGRRAVR